MKATGAAIVALTLFGCSGNTQLRGIVEKSTDGHTYLVVADDNGGQCGALLLDGTPWKHGLNVRGRVAPGIHRLECGTSLEFRIDSGIVFTFNYWGP